MTIIQDLLSNNTQWAEDFEKANPGLLGELSRSQSPQVLWIGCSDSRVPESVITAAKPGDIFVHRNVANQFRREDVSALSALDFSVNALGVRHVVIVGHTNCGGVAGSLDPSSLSEPLRYWLAPLTNSLMSSGDLQEIPEPERLRVAVHRNVEIQVQNVRAIVDEWDKEDVHIQVHGLVYDLASGRLKEL